MGTLNSDSEENLSKNNGEDFDLDDDSWGEDDGVLDEEDASKMNTHEVNDDEEAEYYDEEDEDEAANIALAQA